MEFTHDIIAKGIQNAKESLIRQEAERFVQSKEELLAFDYTEMNRQLSGFLDCMINDYVKNRGETVFG